MLFRAVSKINSMSSKQILYLVTLLVATTILAGSFYWFGWRPTQIKQECAELIIKLEQDKPLSVFQSSSLQQTCEDIGGVSNFIRATNQ